LLNDPEEASRLAEAGYRKFQEQFSQPVILEQYRNLFLELANRSASA